MDGWGGAREGDHGEVAAAELEDERQEVVVLGEGEAVGEQVVEREVVLGVGGGGNGGRVGRGRGYLFAHLGHTELR